MVDAAPQPVETLEMELWNSTHGVSVVPWNASAYVVKGFPVPFNTYPPCYFEFRPIPGDLNMDGHVDIEDLSAILKAYRKYPGYLDPEGFWHPTGDFDLNGDGEIDVFDVVIVAKNFCRTTPDPDYPEPMLDP